MNVTCKLFIINNCLVVPVQMGPDHITFVIKIGEFVHKGRV